MGISNMTLFLCLSIHLYAISIPSEWLDMFYDQIRFLSSVLIPPLVFLLFFRSLNFCTRLFSDTPSTSWFLSFLMSYCAVKLPFFFLFLFLFLVLLLLLCTSSCARAFDELHLYQPLSVYVAFLGGRGNKTAIFGQFSCFAMRGAMTGNIH